MTYNWGCVFIGFCLVLIAKEVCGQALDSIQTVSFIENPRPKAFQLQWRNVSPTQINLRSSQSRNTYSQRTWNEFKGIKLDVPILLKEKYQLFGGVRVGREEFEFQDTNQDDFLFYRRLQENALNRVGVRFMLRRKLNETKFWIARAGADLNGDIIDLNRFGDYFKGNFLFILGEKKDPRTELGYGITFTYNLGAPLILPVFLYRKNFKKHWQLNLSLPKEVGIQYAFSPKMYASGTLGVNGASYHLSGEVLPDAQNLELRYSELNLSIKLEREVYDWLWVSGEVGGLRSLRLYLSRPRERRRNSLVDSERFGSTYVRLSLFVVPPRKLLEKMN